MHCTPEAGHLLHRFFDLPFQAQLHIGLLVSVGGLPSGGKKTFWAFLKTTTTGVKSCSWWEVLPFCPKSRNLRVCGPNNVVLTTTMHCIDPASLCKRHLHRPVLWLPRNALLTVSHKRKWGNSSTGILKNNTGGGLCPPFIGSLWHKALHWSLQVTHTWLFSLC